MVWNWPQVVYAALTGISLLVVLAMDGKDKDPSKYNFGHSLLSVIIIGTILYFGGFWAGAHP